jgi:putative drug exporter of the RND superfamily
MKLSLGTESIARAAARRPWITVGVWAAVLAAAFVMVSALLGGALTNDNRMTNQPESMKAQAITDERLGKSDKIDEMIIVSSPTLTVDDAAFQTQVESLFTDLNALGNTVVQGGATYYMTGDKTLVSADRHATLIPFTMPKDGDQHIEQVYALTDKVNAAGSFTVYNTGTASFNHDAGTLAEDTMKTGETIGISVALIVLAIVFGAIVAATMPIILGVVAIVAALGLTALVGQAMNLTMGVT